MMNYHHQWLKTYARTWRVKEVEYCEGGIPSEYEPLFPNRMCSACNLSLQDSVDPNPREVCAGPSVDINQYKITFQSGSTVSTESVDIARCTAGRCSHTFEPPSNTPSSYDSVSVAAENVVGVGAARTCTTQTISELPEVTRTNFITKMNTCKISIKFLLPTGNSVISKYIHAPLLIGLTSYLQPGYEAKIGPVPICVKVSLQRFEGTLTHLCCSTYLELECI